MSRKTQSCFLCSSHKSQSSHRFPKNPLMRPIWKSICKLSPSDCVDSVRICSNHFTSDDYSMRGSRLMLKKHAYPTLNLDSSLLPRYDANFKTIIENEHSLTMSAIEEIVRKSEENARLLLSNKSSTPRNTNGLNCIDEPAINKKEGEEALCEHCGVVYSGRYHPQPKKPTSNPRVVKRVLSEENKKYRCAICSRKFASEGGLNKHEQTHSSFDSEPYSKWLSKMNNRRLQLQKKHAEKTAKNSYQCLSCPKKFHFLSNLKNHEKTHSPVEDDVEPFYNKILYKKFLLKNSSCEDAS